MNAELINCIIPAFNSKATLGRLILHLESSTEVPLDSLIVVDDGSSDGTAEFVTEHYPQIVLLMGTGCLYWCGSISLGMQKALARNAEHVFWLNHDCRPYRGAFREIIRVLQDPDVGCVSGNCHISGHKHFPVTPGFLNFKSLIVGEGQDLIDADGVNGYFVGFRSELIKKVGLPDSAKFPHYGDGPYTFGLKRRGYRVLVCRDARAEVDYDLYKEMSPFWMVACSNKSLRSWLSFFLKSKKSHYHFRNRWNESRLFRGKLAFLTYPKVQLSLISIASHSMKCESVTL